MYSGQNRCCCRSQQMRHSAWLFFLLRRSSTCPTISCTVSPIEGPVESVGRHPTYACRSVLSKAVHFTDWVSSFCQRRTTVLLVSEVFHRQRTQPSLRRQMVVALGAARRSKIHERLFSNATEFSFCSRPLARIAINRFVSETLESSSYVVKYSVL